MIDEFNARLLRLYGKESITLLPKYRIVRSETQTEKRYGKYNIVTQDTGIWLGVKEGLVEIKKYWYIKPCFIIEKIEPNLNRKDIFYDKYTYEPIYTFLDKDDNELPLVWQVVEMVVWTLEKAEKKFLNESDHLAQEEARLAEESDKVFAELDKPDPIKELPTFNTSTLISKG